MRSNGATYADDGELRLSVVYSTRGERQETLIVKGARARGGDPDLLGKARSQLRKALRFVYIESGQSLESLLQGCFREMLHAVLREHLKDEFPQAAGGRRVYIEGLQSDLLEPCRNRVVEVVQDLFPEMRARRSSLWCQISTRRSRRSRFTLRIRCLRGHTLSEHWAPTVRRSRAQLF